MNKLMLSVITLILSTNIAMAEQCSINFNYGVIIDPTHVRMIERGKTRVQINGEQQLFIDGREISLTPEQQQLLKQFSSGIRQQIPEIVSIAIEGVDIGLKAVNTVIGGLTGENSASHQKIQAKFDELKWRIRARFNQSDQNYYIAPQDLDDFDEIFAGEFEQEIEEIISDSIGTILLAVGEAMITDDSDSESHSEQRIPTFDERIENMGKDLELEVSSRASALEQKAQKFCQQLVELDRIETQLHQAVSALEKFNLIETKEH